MKIIDCQTTKTGIYAIMTDQEKIDLLTKVAREHNVSKTEVVRLAVDSCLSVKGRGRQK